MAKPSDFLHKGKRFDRQGERRFVKDILRAGRWMHPATEQVVQFDTKRLRTLVENTQRWMGDGNKVRFLDGHTEPGQTTSVEKVIGDVTDFVMLGEKLFAVFEPKKKETITGMENGTLDAVSIGTEVDVLLQSGGDRLSEVIHHVAATPWPVVTNQGEFVKLSAELDVDGRECFVPEALSISAQGGDEMKPKELAKLLGLDENSTDEQIKTHLAGAKKTHEDAVTAAATKAVDTLSGELKGHGLRLDAGKVVKLDVPPSDETPKEKDARERLAALEERVTRRQAEEMKLAVEKLLADGKVPPGEEKRLTRLLSLQGKATSVLLGEGGDIQEVGVEIAEEMLSLFKTLPSIGESRLQQLHTSVEPTPDEKKKSEALKEKGRKAARLAQGRKEPATTT